MYWYITRASRKVGQWKETGGVAVLIGGRINYFLLSISIVLCIVNPPPTLQAADASHR
jgi:hypothetical protein